MRMHLIVAFRAAIVPSITTGADGTTISIGRAAASAGGMYSVLISFLILFEITRIFLTIAIKCY